MSSVAPTDDTGGTGSVTISSLDAGTTSGASGVTTVSSAATTDGDRGAIMNGGGAAASGSGGLSGLLWAPASVPPPWARRSRLLPVRA